jgi:hypothetical protein
MALASWRMSIPVSAWIEVNPFTAIATEVALQ